MTTIKDIARHVGVSPSTVSIVLSGKGNDRNISKATQELVFAAAEELAYVPNLSSKKLRARESGTITIELYWGSTEGIELLNIFLRGFEQFRGAGRRHTELLINIYEPGTLSANNALQSAMNCNVAIVANPSEEDLRYLNAIEPAVPVILYNCASDRYSTARLDDDAVGTTAAEYLYSLGHRSAALITFQHLLPGMKARNDAFLRECARVGIQVEAQDIYRVSANPYASIFEAERFRLREGGPTVLVISSEKIAVGFCMEFARRGIRVPEDIQILCCSIGEMEPYLNTPTPISEIQLPVIRLAEEAMHMAVELSQNQKQKREVFLRAPLVPRASTRPL